MEKTKWAGSHARSVRLYTDLAWFWEMSRLDEWEAEGRFVLKMLKRHKRTKGTALLDVGCGHGHHHRFLEGYEITGIDQSPRMLAIARRNNPGVEYKKGRMQTFDLGKRFDAVLALDCLAYNLTLANLERTLMNLSNHLKRGGVLIFTFDHVKETFVQNKTEVSKKSKGDTRLVTIENSFDPDTSDTQYDFTMVLLIRRGGELKVEIDEHKLGLFRLDDVVNTASGVGMRVHLYEADGSGDKYKRKGPVFVCEKVR